ncbi:MAG: methyltransferase domain-containing protein [Chloroflexi bacterium]|nr:methyltransferase domain-containing protein [Chloroflexota bacterium]
MSEERFWNNNVGLTELKGRKFLQMCPPMAAYLTPGTKVLDVGCGPGPITRDIAAMVYPGPVVGVDSEPKSIELAGNLVKESHISNLTFQVGDALQLDFADGSFDVVLSMNVIGWLRDPVRALQEQRRVTREGGWVLVMMADYGNILFYPACPALEKHLAMLSHLNDPSDQEVFHDTSQGRRAVELMSQAGFKEIKIEPYGNANYRGTDGFDGIYAGWMKFYLNLEGPFAALNRKLIALGLLDAQTLLTAQREIEAWHAHPHALYLQMPLLAAGRVT